MQKTRTAMMQTRSITQTPPNTEITIKLVSSRALQRREAWSTDVLTSGEGDGCAHIVTISFQIVAINARNTPELRNIGPLWRGCWSRSSNKFIFKLEWKRLKH
jgi:hypothetical protein